MGFEMGKAWWLCGVAVLIALAVLWAPGGQMSAFGKGGGTKPPPSGKSIYYHGGSGTCRMASDGSGKTTLSSGLTWGRRLSDSRYGDSASPSYYVADFYLSDENSTYPDGSRRYRLMVAPVENSGAVIEILDDPNIRPFRPTFRPGTTPRVTFVAVVWDGSGNTTAGLYQIEFSVDGSTIGDPELLLDADTVTFAEGWVGAQMFDHDWLGESTIVYGDGVYSDSPQIYVGDIDDPTNHVALLANPASYMDGYGWGLQFNSTGSKVIFMSTYSIYEVSTGGNSTPTEWVASTSRGRPTSWCDYLDDDTVVYSWYDTRNNVKDVCKKARGAASASNLTNDVSTSCMALAAR